MAVVSENTPPEITWDEHGGHVTRAFDRWTLTDGDIRGCVGAGLTASRAHYSDLWRRAAAAATGEETGAVFHRLSGGTWPSEFEWMLLAGAWKDAVTAYEVYLEDAAREAFERHGLDMVPRKESEGLKF